MHSTATYCLVALVAIAVVSGASAEDSWFGKREPEVATAIDADACFTRSAPVCTDVMCMAVTDCGFGLDFYPIMQADNKFAHMQYSLVSLTHKKADGTVVRTVSRDSFLSCVDGDSFLTPPSSTVALNVTCGIDKNAYSWSARDRYTLTETSVVAATEDETHTLYDTDGTTELFSWTMDKGSAKLDWSLDWMSTAATESDMVERLDTDTFEVVTKLKWSIPTTFSDILNSGITKIPDSFSPESFGKITTDDSGSVVSAEADAFIKSKVVLIPYVKVCGHTGGAADDFPCVNKRIVTNGEFGEKVSLSGGVEAPTALFVTQSWTGVGPRMDMDPTFKVEEGQFLGGNLNFKLFFIGGIAALGLIVICCCVCCCYCCCKKKKQKTVPTGNDAGVPVQVY